MTNRSANTLTPSDVLRLLSTYRARWIFPTIALAVVALAYALLKTNVWEAAQALVVRNEAHGSVDRPGKFLQTDEMKTTQETILELAKSDSVLAAALETAGPPVGKSSAEWPSPQDIADVRDAVKVTPPNGAEFGKTEVFYVRVQANDKARALALTTAIVDGLQNRFQKLQGDKAHSMIQELERTAELAESDLNEATKRLGKFEASVGSDLSELRILHETPSGNSDLRQKLVAIENESRDAQTNYRAAAQLTQLLREAQGDHSRLVALPDRLLKSHATLSRLIEGLSQSRLRTSTLLGSKSDDHPLVLAAKAEEQEVVSNLQRELANAIRISEVEEKLNQDRYETLRSQLAESQGRLSRLAGLRAEYGNRVAEVKSREKLSEDARRNLSDARASQAAATSSSLINRIDNPTTGTRPNGPGKTVIVLAGMGGGLFVGLALVFFSVPLSNPMGTSAPSQWGNPGAHTVEHFVKTSGNLSLKQALSKIAQQDARWN